MTRFVRDPLLIDFFVDAWKDSKKVSTSSVSIDVSTHSIHAVDGVVTLEFPGAGLEGVGQVVEGADRAQIDHVARKFIRDNFFNVGADLVLLAAHYLAQSVFSSNQLGKTHAAGAMDASGH